MRSLTLASISHELFLMKPLRSVSNTCLARLCYVLIGGCLWSVILTAEQQDASPPPVNEGIREPWFQDRQVVPQSEAPEPVLPETAPERASETARELAERTLITNLRGVYLSEEIETSKPDLAGVHWGEVPESLDREALIALAQPYIGTAVSLNDLKAMGKAFKQALNEQGYLIADVVIPKQDLRDGTVRYVILLGRAENFLVNGGEPPSHLSALIDSKTHAGARLKRDFLRQQLALLNWNPVRQSQVIFRKGSETGYVDVDYQVREPERPYRLYAGFENSGNDTTMDERLYAGVTLWRNPLYDAIINMEYRAAPTTKISETYSGYLSLREGLWGNTVSVFAARAVSRPEIRPFDLKGVFEQIGLRYRIDHSRKAKARLSHSTVLGIDWKSSNSDLQFGGQSVSSTTYQIFQSLAQHTITRPDEYGYTQLVLGGTFSPGGINQHNSNAVFQSIQSGADAQYTYLSAELSRNTRLNRVLRWELELKGQFSDQLLISSERLGMGGKDSVRGYEEFEVSVDSGLIMRNSLHKSPLALREFFGESLTLAPYLFWDYALGSTRGSATAPARPVTLNSVGFGADVTLGETMSAYAILGTQLHDSGRSDGRRNSKAHFGLRIDY